MIELEFTQRPVDIPPDLRLYRRLAVLSITIYECCRGATASFRQLHFLNSLIMDESFRTLYMDFRIKKDSLKILSPSADPYLNRCVSYAIGAELIKQKEVKSSFKLTLTDSGKDFVNELRKNELVQDVFQLANEIGKISEKEIQTAIRMGL